MGWAMSSDMPDRNFDRAGVVEEGAIQSIRGDELTKIDRENGKNSFLQKPTIISHD